MLNSFISLRRAKCLEEPRVIIKTYARGFACSKRAAPLLTEIESPIQTNPKSTEHRIKYSDSPGKVCIRNATI